MRYLSLSLTLLLAASVMVSLPARSDDTTVEPQATAEPASMKGDTDDVDYEAGREPVVSTEAVSGNKDPQKEITAMTGEPEIGKAKSQESASQTERDREEVWVEISQAISGLNDMVGDKMFRDLRRTTDNRMEVRVDVNFWQRVRYETRVDLKNDISNIWHLYVRQYSKAEQSSVYFIDDQTNKTIDIFSQYK